MNYYISDLHFGDERIMNLCERPFDNLKIYEKSIIDKWNAKVREEDTVYLLGDIAANDYFYVIDIIKRLNGKKHLIVGNHDVEMLEFYGMHKVFDSIKYMCEIKDNGRTVFLCHYPVMDWGDLSKEIYHVYGHIHNKTIKNNLAYNQIKKYYSNKLGFNCCVDVTKFEPVTLDEMIQLKEKNKNEPYIN